MAKTNQDRPGYIKNQIAIILIVFAFLLGLMLGAAFSAYRSKTQTSSVSRVQVPNQGQNQIPDDGMSEGIRVLEAKSKMDPDSATNWINLGNAYFDSDQYKKAITAYEKALDLSPGNPNVLTDMGVMYRRDNQPEKAVQAFDKAIRADAEHEVSRFNKGIVLLHDLNDLDGAIAAWQELLKINPSAAAPTGQPVKELIEHYTEHVDD